MGRSYQDGKGNFHPVPYGKEDAKRYRNSRYESGVKCPVCNHTGIRYTHTDTCIHCARLNAIDLYAYAVGAMRFIVVPEEYRGGEISTYFPRGGYGDRVINQAYMDEIKQLHELLGGQIPTPVNTKQAIEMGLELWVRSEPCPRSGHYGIRTLKGHCYFCELERNTKSPRQIAMAASETWYTPTEPCPKCNTLSERRVNDGKCSGCHPNIRKSGDRSPRQAAIAAGQTWYIPDTPCKHCGTLAERNIHNGQCKDCMTPTMDGRRSPDSIMMEAQPDMIISRDQARKLGLKVFRTGEPCTRGHVGFRYVSTGSCIKCLRNV